MAARSVKQSQMVFRSSNSRSPNRQTLIVPDQMDLYDIYLTRNESQISGRQIAPGRENVNARRNIMLAHQNTMAQSTNARSRISMGGNPKLQQSSILDFNPRKYITKDLKESDILQLKDVFDTYDSEKVGLLSPNDLQNLLQKNGFNPTKETLYEIFAEMDEEELGGITFHHFMRMLFPDKPQQESKATIRRVYKKYDRQNKGFVTLDDLRNFVYKDLHEEIDDDVLTEVFRKTDSNNDGKMTFEDFYTVMTKKTYH